MVSAGFDVLPGGGQGFGRSLPFGSSVLLEITQAGSLRRIVEVRSSPGMKALLSGQVWSARGRLSPQGHDRRRMLEPSPQHRG